jgi:hypothetical protein
VTQIHPPHDAPADYAAGFADLPEQDDDETGREQDFEY